MLERKSCPRLPRCSRRRVENRFTREESFELLGESGPGLGVMLSSALMTVVADARQRFKIHGFGWRLSPSPAYSPL